MYEPSHALGLIRRDIAGCPDRWRELLNELAERHGFRLVFTVELHARPCIANLALAQHITEHSAAAVVSFCPSGTQTLCGT